MCDMEEEERKACERGPVDGIHIRNGQKAAVSMEGETPLSIPQQDRRLYIWLILPAVVCFSQGLSHACVRIHGFNAKLVCEWLITPALISTKCDLDDGVGRVCVASFEASGLSLCQTTSVMFLRISI
jgi:hypothetical protein